MDSKTERMSEALKEYFDQTEISYQGWENASSICKLAYKKYVELSARLSPEIAGNRIAQAHFEITSALKTLADIVRETNRQE